MKKGLLITGVVILLAGIAFYISSIQKTQDPLPIDETSELTQNDEPQAEKVYSGILPCADCPGIDTTLILKPDNTYTQSSIYQERNEDEPFEITGEWNIEKGIPGNEDAEYYVLTEDSGNASYYLIENETTLVQLDQDRNLIDSPYNTSLTLQKG